MQPGCTLSCGMGLQTLLFCQHQWLCVWTQHAGTAHGAAMVCVLLAPAGVLAQNVSAKQAKTSEAMHTAQLWGAVEGEIPITKVVCCMS